MPSKSSSDDYSEVRHSFRAKKIITKKPEPCLAITPSFVDFRLWCRNDRWSFLIYFHVSVDDEPNLIRYTEIELAIKSRHPIHGKYSGCPAISNTFAVADLRTFSTYNDATSQYFPQKEPLIQWSQNLDAVISSGKAKSCSKYTTTLQSMQPSNNEELFGKVMTSGVFSFTKCIVLYIKKIRQPHIFLSPRKWYATPGYVSTWRFSANSHN